MSKVQVPSTELVKIKEEIEREKLKIVQERQKRLKSQQRAAWLKAAMSTAVAVGGAGLGLYYHQASASRKQRQLELEKERLAFQRQKFDEEFRASVQKMVVEQQAAETQKELMKLKYDRQLELEQRKLDIADRKLELEREQMRVRGEQAREKSQRLGKTEPGALETTERIVKLATGTTKDVLQNVKLATDTTSNIVSKSHSAYNQLPGWGKWTVVGLAGSAVVANAPQMTGDMLYGGVKETVTGLGTIGKTVVKRGAKDFVKGVLGREPKVYDVRRSEAAPKLRGTYEQVYGPKVGSSTSIPAYWERANLTGKAQDYWDAAKNANATEILREYNRVQYPTNKPEVPSQTQTPPRQYDSFTARFVNMGRTALGMKSGRRNYNRR
jgi:hypothetical protein